MDRWLCKLLASCVCFILPFLCTMLPHYLSAAGRCATNHAFQRAVLGHLMCLGGGIFFGTYLLHMSPEVAQLIDQALLRPYGIKYPLAELLSGIGFFLVLFVETLVIRCNSPARQVHRNEKQVAVVTGGDGWTSLDGFQTSQATSSTGVSDVKETELRASQLPPPPPPLPPPLQQQVQQDQLHNNNIESQQHKQTQLHSNSPEKFQSCKENAQSHMKNGDATNGTSAQIQQQSHHHDHGGHHHHVDVHQMHSTRSLMLVLALSLHRIFEGMSVGLQQTASGVGSLLLAVMCHETVIAFSLGLQFVRAKLPVIRLLITSIVCSIVMPSGVVIGIAMTESAAETDATVIATSSMLIANGVLQSVAVGTFIYVTFFEILMGEFSEEAGGVSLSKVIAVFIGFVMMALLDLIPEEQMPLLKQQHDSMFTLAGNSSLPGP